MRRLTLPLAIICLSSLFLFSPVHGKYNPNTSSAINLEQTGEYLANWLDSENFPESITIAYYYVYSLPALGKTISPYTKRQIIDFIKRCQGDNGGFASIPGRNKETDVVSTYFALRSLALLGSIRTIDREDTASYIVGLVKNGRGLANTDRKNEKPSLTATYYGIQSLVMLGELDKIDADKTASFVKEFLTANSSFSFSRGGEPTPKATYMGVTTLDSLDGLTKEIKSGAAAFLKGVSSFDTPETGNGQKFSSIQEMADILQTLDHLSLLEQTETVRMYEYVKSLYSRKNGGFGNAPGLESTPVSTYLGIVCLVELGKLQDPLPKRGVSKKQMGRLFYHLLICEGQRPRFVF